MARVPDCRPVPGDFGAPSQRPVRRPSLPRGGGNPERKFRPGSVLGRPAVPGWNKPGPLHSRQPRSAQRLPSKVSPFQPLPGQACRAKAFRGRISAGRREAWK